MRKYNAFTLTEIIVVLATIGILSALAFPVFSRVRENGRSTQCKSHLKQIGLALQMYEADADRMPVAWNGDEFNVPVGEVLPYGTGVGWTERVFPYLKEKKLYSCPSDATFGDSGIETSFALNLNVSNKSFSEIKNLDRTVICSDDYPGGAFNYTTTLTTSIVTGSARHLERNNCLFADGHVKPLTVFQANDECQSPTQDLSFPYTMCP